MEVEELGARRGLLAEALEEVVDEEEVAEDGGGGEAGGLGGHLGRVYVI